MKTNSLVLAVVMLLIGLFLGSVVGVMATRDTWEKSAIEAGAGRYTCNKEGKTTWVWTTKKDEVDGQK